MTKLLVVFILALLFAHSSEEYSRQMHAAGGRYEILQDNGLIWLIIVLSLFSGLRTSYNDTYNYVMMFQKLPALGEYLSDPKNLNVFTNPLFYAYISFLRTVWNDPQVMIFTTSAFTQVCFILFFKRYSENFTFSIFLYFTLGTFCLSMAAMKQVVAMAVVTLAIPCLERRQWVRYYLAVFVAMLVHTYALVFAVLPFFTQRPWRQFTFLVVLSLILVMTNFHDFISEFMDQANELGKTLDEYEVFDDHTVNLLRLAVYAVPPLLSLVFSRWVFEDSTNMDHLLVHMSIISLAFMSLGTQSGANMFGRMANYFELGTIVCLPWMLKQTFSRGSSRIVMAIAAVCFLGFFVYQNAINGSFDSSYRLLTWW